MNGDKFHKFRVTLGVTWSPGTLKAIAVAVLMAVGGLWKFWDHIASLLPSTPVWALVALLASSLLCLPSSVIAAPKSPSPYSHTYTQSGGFFSCVQ